MCAPARSNTTSAHSPDNPYDRSTRMNFRFHGDYPAMPAPTPSPVLPSIIIRSADHSTSSASRRSTAGSRVIATSVVTDHHLHGACDLEPGTETVQQVAVYVAHAIRRHVEREPAVGDLLRQRDVPRSHRAEVDRHGGAKWLP